MKKLTPMQKLLEAINFEKQDTFTKADLLKWINTFGIHYEKDAFIEFGNTLLENQVGSNGCGCGKDGGGDYPEKLFEKQYGKRG